MKSKNTLLAEFLDQRKATCPACDAQSSSVTAGFLNDGECPFCHLPSTALAELLLAQERGAEESLTKRLADQAREIVKLKSDLSSAKYALDEIRGLVRDYDAQGGGS